MSNELVIKPEDAAMASIEIMCVNVDMVRLVNVRLLDADEYEHVADFVIERLCYRNAIITGEMLDATAVVFGMAYMPFFGIAIEHAWFEMGDGTHCDPTYQKLDAQAANNMRYLERTEYYELIRVPIDNYLELSKEVFSSDDDDDGRIINFADFRRAPKYREHFTVQHKFINWSKQA